MKTVYLLLATMLFCEYSASYDVETAFRDNEIVPDILGVAPTQMLEVSYPSGVFASLGNMLTPTQVKDKPQVTWEAEEGAYYTLVMVDADTPSRKIAKSFFGRIAKVIKRQYREIRHWTVMNIPGASVQDGEEVAEYLGAVPLQDTGFHRYVLLVYQQKYGKVQNREPYIDNRTISNRPLTSVTRFARKYNLGEPVFGNFFQAQYDEYSDKLLGDILG